MENIWSDVNSPKRLWLLYIDPIIVTAVRLGGLRVYIVPLESGGALVNIAFLGPVRVCLN